MITTARVKELIREASAGDKDKLILALSYCSGMDFVNWGHSELVELALELSSGGIHGWEHSSVEDLVEELSSFFEGFPDEDEDNVKNRLVEAMKERDE